MASQPLMLLSSLVILSFASSLFHFTNASPFVLPVVKDNNKSQYFTSFLVGTPPTTRVYLVISLQSAWSWFTCDIVGYTSSSTYRPVPCENSPRCAYLGSSFCFTCNGPSRPSCNNNTCFAEAYTPVSWGGSIPAGGLIEDVISLYKASPNSVQLSKTSLPDYPFTCVNKLALKGLSPYTKGFLSLARYTYALHARISSAFKVPRKFALCLPASSTSISGLNGAIYFGGGPYHLPATSSVDLSKSLITTPLVVNPHPDFPFGGTNQTSSIEYFINLKSIQVDGTPIRINNSLLSFDNEGFGGTKISTLDPYSALQRGIYTALINVFVSKAKSLNIARVASVDPFGACFNASTITNTKTGLNVPIIDFVLDGKNVKWRIYGANSMVKVSDNVLCLAFVDGGPGGTQGPLTPIVIGAKQMEDTLVEIDLEANKLGFTSSLLQMGTTCSQFKGI